MWYFGATGLNFNAGGFPPTTLASGMSTGEGCTSIADQNGSLLFYSDGTRIWDNTHALMPNANGFSYPAQWDRMLSGDGSSTQSVIIGPVVGNANKFYVFTTDGQTCSPDGPKNEWDGLYYTVVNMNLNGGRGDVDTSYIRSLGFPGNKIPLVDTVSEKITLAIHANGVDYWVVTLRHYTNDIYAYKVTCNGVSTTPVISPGGGGYSSPAGYLMASMDGKALVIGHNAAVTGTGVQYAEFNNNTGQVFNKQTLAGQGNFYGVCFSPNDSIIYATNVTFSNSPELHRFQRYAPSIAATQVITALPASRHPQAIQKGPDGRMYIAQVNGANLSVLHTPNNFSNPSYAANVVPPTGAMGLPNFFDAYVYGEPPSFTRKDTTICAMTPIKIGRDSSWGWSYQWNPAVGLSNPTISNPVASPVATTTYVVSIILPCDTLYDTLILTVLPAPVLTISPTNFSICAGGNISLSAYAGAGTYSFSWNTGNTNSSIAVQPSNNSIYTLTVTGANSCATDTSINVVVNSLPIVSVAGNNLICAGNTSAFTASGANTYVWLPTAGISSTTGSVINVAPSTTMSTLR